MPANSPKQKPQPAGRSWRNTGKQMPNTTWTQRAEAARGEPKPQRRKNTQQNKAKHGASRSPNPGKSHKDQDKRMGRAEAPTQRNQHKRTRQNTRGEPKPQPRDHTQSRTKYTGRAEAPTQRSHTTEQGKTHGASRSPNPGKSHKEQDKRMGRAEAPTQGSHTEQDKIHRASRSPNTGEGSREPKILTTRNHKNHPTRRGEEERKTKATQRKEKD